LITESCLSNIRKLSYLKGYYNTAAIINANYPAVFDKRLFFDGTIINKDKEHRQEEKGGRQSEGGGLLGKMGFLQFGPGKWITV
jgi:hypothetical protein